MIIYRDLGNVYYMKIKLLKLCFFPGKSDTNGYFILVRGNYYNCNYCYTIKRSSGGRKFLYVIYFDSKTCVKSFQNGSRDLSTLLEDK